MKAAVFDLDGTLVNSAPDIASALSVALVRHGMRPIDARMARHILGGGPRMIVRSALSLAGGDLDCTDAVLADYTEAYLANPVSGTTVHADAFSALGRLKNAGVRIGVCTNKQTELAHRVLAGTGLASFMDAVVGFDDVSAPKPDPAHLLATVAALGAKAADAVYVGDTELDEQTARAAGVRYHHVAWGRPIPGSHMLIADFGALAAEVTEELWEKEVHATEH